jgi:hypothetical protein
MRMEKVKNKAGLTGRLRHNTRERVTPNIDTKKTFKNWVDGGSVSQVMKRYSQMLPDKIRKNAVVAVEVMMTASPDFKGDWEQYLKNCDQWAAELFGKENVLSIAHHFDETTPHTHILVMPLKDKKLNAKHFIGGSRDRMTELQSDVFEKVGYQAGLDRGQLRSETRARHARHTLAGKAEELVKKEKLFNEIYKHPATEIKRAISVFEELKTKTPYDFRKLADNIQKKDCLNWGEYREKMQHELDKGKKKKQQQKKSVKHSR